MRGRFCLAGIGLLVLTGCGAPTEAAAMPDPQPTIVDLPAYAAGGACRLLDFAVINKTTGLRFDVAAASEQADTHTCVVRSEHAVTPDLTLSVSETEIDLAGFKADIVPRGARTVKGLGRAAYQVVVAPGRKQGPAAEVGWLASDGRLASLRYTLAQGQAPAAAQAYAPKLVALAKQVDTRNL